MITRWFVINDWDIRCLFSFDKRDKAKVLDALFWADAPNSIVTQVSENINAGRLNEGFCYSRPSLRRTVLGTGIAESGPEVLDTMVHEIIHICQHIAMEDGMDPYGEEISYLGGHISREISGIVCELSCPRCHKK